MDLVKDLAEMALGSRLKRLTKRMNTDISQIYEDLGVDFQARWFPIVYLLAKQQSMSVTEIADSLGFTHTTINNFSKELLKRQLLTSSTDPKDKRKRLLQLSPKGRTTVKTLTPVWSDIRTVVENLLWASEPNLLAAISGVEQQLDKAEMYTRIRTQIRPRLLEQIEVIEYRPHLRKHFRQLNYEWLDELFQIEDADREQLDDPNGQIIKNGGFVYFAKVRSEIVGTAALQKHDNGVFELVKMAVARESRNKLVGTKLTEFIVDKVTAMGQKVLYLETHPSMTQAIHFYERLGFIQSPSNDLPVKYSRARIVMKRDL